MRSKKNKIGYADDRKALHKIVTKAQYRIEDKSGASRKAALKKITQKLNTISGAMEELKELKKLNEGNEKELQRTATQLNNIEFDMVQIKGILKSKNLHHKKDFAELLKNRKLQYNALKKYFNTLAKFR